MKVILHTSLCLLLLCLVLVHCERPFASKEDMCAFLCKHSNGCPKSCNENMSAWAKRSLDHRFDDYSFDDYLFMKLLGRNLQG